MKRCRWIIIACMMIACLASLTCAPNESDVIESNGIVREPITVPAEDNSMINAARSSSDASVWMGAYDHELYFCPFDGEYQGWLCKFEDRGVQKVYQLNTTPVVYGLVGSYLYFNQKAEDGDTVACYSFHENCIHKVYSGDVDVGLSARFDEQSIYLPLFNYDYKAPIEYVQIQGNEVVQITSQIADEQSVGLTPHKPINSDVVIFSSTYGRTMIPTEFGEVIHQQGCGDMLYLSDADNRLIPLLDVPCLSSTSAIAVVNDYVYCSLIRYEKYGDLGQVRFENDSVEGTYRISLEDYTVEKLNDSIYDGLYYFGDTYIYACDSNERIYRLNLDGSVKDRLL